MEAPARGFKGYWFEGVGKPTVLMEYLKSHSLKNPEEYGKQKTITLSTLSASSDSDDISDIALLAQAGYLTIKALKYEDTVFLGYPNLEVHKAMAKLHLEKLLDGRIADQVGAGPILEQLASENAEQVVHILKTLFEKIDYRHYPVTDESSLRAFVQVYFEGAGLKTEVEHHNAFGRSDLEVSIKKGDGYSNSTLYEKTKTEK